MKALNTLTDLPMTQLEQMLKACFLQRPDIQDHILSSTELSDYIAWMAHSFGRQSKITVASLPIRPNNPHMRVIADKLMADPMDDTAIAQLSSGYDRQSEDFFISVDHDISVSRMLRYMPAHWHTNNYFEIYYAFSGNCSIHFPEEVIELKRGTVLIVAPSAVHASPCYCDDGILMYYMLRSSTFDQVFWNQLPADSLMATFFRQALSGQHSASYLHFETGADEDIEQLLLQIHHEFQKEEPYKAQLINVLMSAFFILLLRRHESSVRLPRTEDFYWKHEFSAILNHIQTHYADVTLAELATRFHYSEKQVSRIVQGCMGISYNQLILKLRMECAVRMLRRGNASIDNIAAAVGYSTKSSFYRAFSHYFGCTPGEYLQSEKSAKSNTAQ